MTGEETYETNYGVELLNDEETLEHYKMYAANSKILRIRKDQDKIIRNFPLDVQQVVRSGVGWQSYRNNPIIYNIPFNVYSKLSNEGNILERAQKILDQDNIGLPE